MHGMSDADGLFTIKVPHVKSVRLGFIIDPPQLFKLEIVEPLMITVPTYHFERILGVDLLFPKCFGQKHIYIINAHIEAEAQQEYHISLYRLLCEPILESALNLAVVAVNDAGV